MKLEPETRVRFENGDMQEEEMKLLGLIPDDEEVPDDDEEGEEDNTDHYEEINEKDPPKSPEAAEYEEGEEP